MFKKKKVFAYENSEGDKGIIIAKSYEDAKNIFHKNYPKRKIIDNDEEFCGNATYLFEMDEVKNNELYNCFPW